MMDDGCDDYGCDFGISGSTASSSGYSPDGSGGGDKDAGIPNPLHQQLTDAGVSEGFLNSVTLIVYDEAPLWDVDCWGNSAAHQEGNTIIFCSSQYFDTDRVIPYLVHELVHVRQYQEEKHYWWKYQIEYLKHGYKDNPYEKEAYSCGDTIWQSYNASTDLPPLNVMPCNLP